MSNVSRDPAAYYPSEHAVIQRRERDFDWDTVSHTIEHGERWSGSEEDTVELFHSDITVVANVESGEIITVVDVPLEEWENP